MENANNIKQPKLTLKERYSDEFLEKAECRRKALQYKRMHVGQINTDRMAHMIKLLYQVHQNYYLGYFEASCTLAGSMFEQSLMILLEEKINEDGFISVKKSKNGKPSYEKITNVEDLAQCNIGILISIVGYYKMLENRKKIASIYNHILSKNKKIIIPELKNDYCESSYHLYLIRIKDFEEKDRDLLIEKMFELGIILNVHYLPLPFQKVYIDLGYNINDYNNAYNLYKNEITLPLYSSLNEVDARYIASNIAEYLNKINT